MKTDRLSGREGTARVLVGVGEVSATTGAGSIAVDSLSMAGTGVLSGGGLLQAANSIPAIRRAAKAIRPFMILLCNSRYISAILPARYNKPEAPD